MRVGIFYKSSAIQRKSAKASWTPLDSVTIFPLTWQRDSCICLNIPLDPGRASAIERISPRTRCHLSTPILRWERGMADTISSSRATRWGGRVIVMLMESTIHPSRVWHVEHEQSLASSFFSERTSLRYLLSCLSRGLNTLSNTWKILWRTWRQRCRGPCASPRKSSTNTSMYANSFALGRNRYGSRVN